MDQICSVAAVSLATFTPMREYLQGQTDVPLRMLIGIVGGQTLISGSLQQVSVSSYEHQGDSLG
jgi:hypothetical protein